MTDLQAMALLPETIVMWDNSSDDLGTVRKVGPGGVYIDWQNGQRGWIAYQDMAAVSLWQPEA